MNTNNKEKLESKNELKFFPELYCFPYQPSLKRMLLEGNEIDLYVWIDENFQLDSFQIILEDAFILSYKFGKKLELGGIGRLPINRGAAIINRATTQLRVLDCLAMHSCPKFPQLFESILKITEGELSQPVFLSDFSEKKVFSEAVVC